MISLYRFATLSYRAEHCDDPEERFIRVLQYYLAGWHIKPKGVKKPYVIIPLSQPLSNIRRHICACLSPLTYQRYNPVLGEFFRCRYDYPDGSKGFYIAEQGISGSVASPRP